MNNKQKIKDLLATEKVRTIVIIIGVVAIALLFFSSTFESDNKAVKDSGFNTQSYQNALSDEILNMVTSVEGAGNAQILLTLENSYEYIYLDDGKTLQKINEPKVRGVVVACEGADSALVRECITELLTTALNIPSTKVCISKLN